MPTYLDRAQETTTTTGTGTYTLAGAVAGFQSFAGVGDGNTCYYAITNNLDWEVGLGTYTAAGTTLARTTVLSSSNGGAAVNWGAGTKNIWVDYPAVKASRVIAGTTNRITVTNGDGVAGDPTIDLAAATDVRNYLDTAVYVADRTALAALDQTKDTVAWLKETGREGAFQWNSANLSTLVTADTLQGVYVAPSSDPTGASGAWVRIYEGVLQVEWFGAKNDNSADAQPGIQAAIDLAEAIGSGITEGPVGSIFAPPGSYRTDASIAFTRSIVFRMEGTVRYTPTTGSAIIVGDALNTQHTFYDISIEAIRAVNGNGSPPTSINASGCSGIEIRRAQFSSIRVGQVIAFTKYGAWLNSSNDQFTGQHIQDNDLFFGQTAYNGAGVFAESVSAADGACQVNRIYIQNSFSNFRNVEVGEAGDNNTNHNLISIEAIDVPGVGGSELRVFGWYNMITLGFVDTNGIVSFESGSVSNVIEIGRNAANVTYSDAGTANRAFFADGVIKGIQRYVTAATGTEPLAVESTDAGATYAQLLELYRNSASPADNDGLFGIVGYFNDAAGNKTQGLRIRTDAPTVANGNENLRLLIDTIVGGTLANRAIIWQGLILGSPAGGDKGTGTLNVASGLYVNNILVSPPGAPVTKTADFTVANTEKWIINNRAATNTATLPIASSFPGREIGMSTIQAQAVVSASSDVVPRAGGAAGTAILPATDGAWAMLVSDGTNWIIMQSGV